MTVALQAREQWLEERRQGIGGSDAPAIAGLDPWKSRLHVWLDKTGRLPLEAREETEWQRWGRLLEEAITSEFEHRSGLHVSDRQRVAVHRQRYWQRATLDGYVRESPYAEPLGILEIKTASSFRSPHDWSKPDQIPDGYQVQVQHNLAVTGLAQAWVAVLLDGQRLVIHELAADPAAIAVLLEMEEAFWRMVEADEPPPADERPRTAQALRQAYLQPQPGSVLELSDEQAQLIEDYVSARAAEREAATRAQLAQNALMALLGEREIALHREREVLSWKGFQTSRVDLDALRARHPRLVRRFTQTTATRRFQVARAAIDPEEEQ